MQKIVCPFFTLIILSLNVYSQAPGIAWQNTIGGNGEETFSDIRQTRDGGFILGGYSESGISGDKTETNQDISFNTSDYWIIKIDSLGNIEWQNTIGGSYGDHLKSIEQTRDGGY